MLAWLGVLAGLQIAFELLYDYFVVLALPRVVFILQLVWLLVLVPVLAVGARAGTVAGVIQAEIAVAAGVVLPWYLWELRKAGIRSSVLARRLRLPLVGAMAAGLACWGVGQLIQNELAALGLSAAAGATVIALLILRLWPELAAAGQRSAQAVGQPSVDAPAAPEPGQLTEPGELTAAAPVPARAAQANGGRAAVPLVRDPAPAAEPAARPPVPAWSPGEPESLAERFFRWWDATNPPEPSLNGSGPHPTGLPVPDPALRADPVLAASQPASPEPASPELAPSEPAPSQPSLPEPASPTAAPGSLAGRFFRWWDAMNPPATSLNRPHPNGPHPNGNGSGVAVPAPPEHNGSQPPQFRATAAALGWEHPPPGLLDPDDAQEL